MVAVSSSISSTALVISVNNSNKWSNVPFRPGFDLSASSDINTGKKVARPELWVYFIRNEYCIHLVPQPKFHSALHLVTQASLGLAHQEHNGSAGGILDLSYSCATMSTWFLRRDRLLAPNAISSTDHTCVLEGACVRVCILVRVQSTKTSRNILAESNDHQWNPIWGPVFWVQFPLLKTVGRTSRPAARVCLAGLGQVTGNMFNGACNGDTSNHKCSRDKKCERIIQLVIREAATNELTTWANAENCETFSINNTADL